MWVTQQDKLQEGDHVSLEILILWRVAVCNNMPSAYVGVMKSYKCVRDVKKMELGQFFHWIAYSVSKESQ